MNNYSKWCLEIDNTEINMPTREHALKIGKFLCSFKVPLKVMEITISIKKENGKIVIGDKIRKDYSYLLDTSPSNDSDSDDAEMQNDD